MTEKFSRPPRLPNFDYTQPGAYFITINTANKVNIFGIQADNSVTLNQLGLIASSCLQEIPNHFSHTELDEFIIMPNHVHGIIWIVSPETIKCGDTACCVSTEYPSGNLEEFGKPVKGSIPTIIRSFKSAVTKLIHKENPNLKIWQSNYYEHVI